MSLRERKTVAIIIPTLNEVMNLDPLFESVFRNTEKGGISVDIIVADGGSTDGTQEKTREWGKRAPVFLVESDGKGGLAGDVLAAAQNTSADVVVIMDADLSHPPEALPELIKPLLNDTYDMVIGSRYIPGGGTPGWPLLRRLTSRFATTLAWPLVSAHDPMAGYFAIDRKLLLDLGKHATGFKIGMEVLARGGDSLRVGEVPITFVDRERGLSKMGTTEVFRCLRQIASLMGGATSTGNTVRFGFVGLIGLIVDLTIFNILISSGVDIVLSHTISFLVATVSNYILNARWAFAASARDSNEPVWKRYIRFLIVAVMAWFLRGAVLGSFIETMGISPRWAIFPAIAAATLVNYVGSAFFVFPLQGNRSTPEIRWRVFALAIVAYSVVLRLAFAGVVELLPEEAYYWNYAQHPALGYLDHPPLIAWLIWIGTHILGNNELGVRLPTMFCWLISAFFIYRLAADMTSKTNAMRVLLLMAIFPIYLSTGFLATPDAPLYAAWAGSLFYLEQALVRNRSRAWIGVGIFIGLAMMSKYTAALLGPSALLLILLDKSSRKWFFRPQPYLAIIISLLIFLPVIIWNYNHDWVSFAFQGNRRWTSDHHFYLHQLIGSAILLLTPLGIIGVVVAFLPEHIGGIPLIKHLGSSEFTARVRLFSLLFTLTPLAVFIIHSLQDNPKLNWTGPVWLSSLPLLALTMTTLPGVMTSRITRMGQALWKPTAVGLLLLTGGAFYATAIGPPLIPRLNKMSLPVAWREMSEYIESVELNVISDTEEEPLIVGLDDYFITAEYAFYDPAGDRGRDTAGLNLFGMQGLMWDYWCTPASVAGRTVIIVDFNKDSLTARRIERRFWQLGPIQSLEILKNGHVAGKFYYRICHGYSPIPLDKLTTGKTPVRTTGGWLNFASAK